MASKYIFSESDKAQVKAAVEALERESCGEIVPYFVQSSDDYQEANWYAASICGLLTAVGIGVLSFAWLLPMRVTPLEVSGAIVALMVVGFVAPMVFPVLKRWLLPNERLQDRVLDRAKCAFLDEGVYKTEERVGILIFVSQLEHRVVVLGDEGINSRLKGEDWQHVVDEVIRGVKSGETAKGMVAAIGLCKDLLLQHGFVRKSTDFNELHDGLRLGE